MGRIGRYKRRIEIFEPVLTRDATGGSSVAWTLIAATWASVRIDSGNRALEYMQAKNERPYTIMMRQDITVLPKYKIVYNGIDLVVNSVVLNEDKYTYQTISAGQKIV